MAEEEDGIASEVDVQETALEDHSGWVVKKGKRFFLYLKNGLLYWASKEPTDSEAEAEQKLPSSLGKPPSKTLVGAIELEGALVAQVTELSFEITTSVGSNFLFSTSQPQMCNKWLEAIEHVLSQFDTPEHILQKTVGDVLWQDKRGALLYNNQKRFLLLRRGMLIVYANEGDTVPELPPFDLASALLTPAGRSKFKLKMTGGAEVEFGSKAGDTEDIAEWVGPLALVISAIKTSSPDALNEATIRGEQSKKGNIMRSRRGWVMLKGKPRLLVLRHNVLLWYEKEAFSHLAECAQRGFPLSGCDVSGDKTNPCAFNVTESGGVSKHTFVCSDEALATTWRMEVQAVVERANFDWWASDTHKVLKTGHMQLKGKSREFKLSSRALSWADGDRKYSFSLHGCRVEVLSESHNSRQFAVLLPTGAKHVFQLNDVKEAVAWSTTLHNGVLTCEREALPTRMYGVSLSDVATRRRKLLDEEVKRLTRLRAEQPASDAAAEKRKKGTFISLDTKKGNTLQKKRVTKELDEDSAKTAGNRVFAAVEEPVAFLAKRARGVKKLFEPDATEFEESEVERLRDMYDRGRRNCIPSNANAYDVAQLLLLYLRLLPEKLFHNHAFPLGDSKFNVSDTQKIAVLADASLADVSILIAGRILGLCRVLLKSKVRNKMTIDSLAFTFAPLFFPDPPRAKEKSKEVVLHMHWRDKAMQLTKVMIEHGEKIFGPDKPLIENASSKKGEQHKMKQSTRIHARRLNSSQLVTNDVSKGDAKVTELALASLNESQESELGTSGSDVKSNTSSAPNSPDTRSGLRVRTNVIDVMGNTMVKTVLLRRDAIAKDVLEALRGRLHGMEDASVDELTSSYKLYCRGRKVPPYEILLTLPQVDGMSNVLDLSVRHVDLDSEDLKETLEESLEGHLVWWTEKRKKSPSTGKKSGKGKIIPLLSGSKTVRPRSNSEASSFFTTLRKKALSKGRTSTGGLSPRVGDRRQVKSAMVSSEDVKQQGLERAKSQDEGLARVSNGVETMQAVGGDSSKHAANDEAKKKKAEEAEMEAKKKADEAAADAKKKADEEAEAKKKAEADAEAKKKADEDAAEAKKKAEAEAEAKKKAEQDAEAEAKRKAEEEAKANAADAPSNEAPNEAPKGDAPPADTADTPSVPEVPALPATPVSTPTPPTPSLPDMPPTAPTVPELPPTPANDGDKKDDDEGSYEEETEDGEAPTSAMAYVLAERAKNAAKETQAPTSDGADRAPPPPAAADNAAAAPPPAADNPPRPPAAADNAAPPPPGAPAKDAVAQLKQDGSAWTPRSGSTGEYETLVADLDADKK